MITDRAVLILVMAKIYAATIPYIFTDSELVIMAAKWNGQAIIFSSCGFFLSSIYLSVSSPNLSGCTLDVYHI